jgi:ParB/RepB/Spo0J family partition protein
MPRSTEQFKTKASRRSSLKAVVPVGRMLPVERIDPNPGQPRREMGDLDELTQSVRDKGVLEPLLVLPTDAGRWMIIAGERRWRAALAAGLLEVPCVEHHVGEREVAELALVENMQRKDMTPLEEADGIADLVGRFGYTHEETAKKLGRGRTAITEYLSIAALPTSVREECRRADIHSKRLLLEVSRQQTRPGMRRAIRRIVARGMVRKDEARAVRRGKVSLINSSTVVHKQKTVNTPVIVSGCLCDPHAHADEDPTQLLVALLKSLSSQARFTHYKRVLVNAAQEVEEYSTLDAFAEDDDLIVQAIQQGCETAGSINKYTGIEKHVVEERLAVMVASGRLGSIDQGGKTEGARGQVNCLYYEKE